MDDGRLTDNIGRMVNFKNTFIIMTSNIGSGIIQENLGKLTNNNRGEVLEKTRIQVFELLKQTLRPEFLNRVDDLIMFAPLDETEIAQIVLLQFNLVKKMLAENNIEIVISEKAIKWLSLHSFDQQYGARPVKRMLQKYLLNELSKQLIAGSIDKSKPIQIDSDKNDLIFTN